MESFLTQAGYLALIVFAFVEACSIPISSEITFGFAGVLAYQGHLNLALVIIIGSLAEFAGSFTSYLIGRRGGRPAVDRFGKYVLLTQRDLDRAERFFAGRGAWTVTVARLIPLLRAFAGLVSGLIEVPAGPFAIFNLIGTVIWAAALSSIGYGVGSAWSKVSHYLSLGGYVVALFVVVPLAALILLRLREFRKEKRAAEQAIAAGPAAMNGQDDTAYPERTEPEPTPFSGPSRTSSPASSRPGSHRRGSAPR
ncbi:MAG TPA: DedA family protein [Streptosporangiaceae bacterium]|jgi:membrane protein DedA with SNARE-associated domain|nr:DedA family protein [Streptosporangiaceae bacterium]